MVVMRRMCEEVRCVLAAVRLPLFLSLFSPCSLTCSRSTGPTKACPPAARWAARAAAEGRPSAVSSVPSRTSAASSSGAAASSSSPPPPPAGGGGGSTDRAVTSSAGGGSGGVELPPTARPVRKMRAEGRRAAGGGGGGSAMDGGDVSSSDRSSPTWVDGMGGCVYGRVGEGGVAERAWAVGARERDGGEAMRVRPASSPHNGSLSSHAPPLPSLRPVWPPPHIQQLERGQAGVRRRPVGGRAHGRGVFLFFGGGGRRELERVRARVRDSTRTRL